MSYAPEHCWYLERIGITELPNYILQNSKVGYFVVISKGIIGSVLENDFGPPPRPPSYQFCTRPLILSYLYYLGLG